METWRLLLAGQQAAEPRENQKARVLGWLPQGDTSPAHQSTQLCDKRSREQDIPFSDSPAEPGND